MTSSKSQPKKGFAYDGKDDQYTIQTKDLLMMVVFKSPIKEISEFMETLEKY